MSTFKYNRLDKNDVAVLLVDHQSGLYQLRPGFLAGRLQEQRPRAGRRGEVLQAADDSHHEFRGRPERPARAGVEGAVSRTRRTSRGPGNINAWDNEDFVKAVKATGKKQLLIAGIVTEVCVAFPALSALEEGYEVFVCHRRLRHVQQDDARRGLVAHGSRPAASS